MIGKEVLYDLYVVKGMSSRRIGAALGIGHGKILRWLKAYDIHVRNRSECVSGHNNPMYGKTPSDAHKTKISQASRKLSHEEFAEKMSGFSVVGVYCGENFPVTIKCNCCGSEKTLKQAKNCLKYTQKCWTCDKKNWQVVTGQSPGRPRKYGLSEVREFCSKYGLTFIGDEYLGIHARHKFKCPVGHVWMTTFGEIMRRADSETRGCKKCVAQSLKIPNGEVESRLSAANLQLLVPYVNTHEKHDVKCLVCDHVWNVSLYPIWNMGSGCPKCNLKLNEKLTGKYIRELLPDVDVRSFCLKEKVFHKGNLVRKHLFIDYKFERGETVVFVEYNGIQHYQQVSFYGHQLDFEKQRIRDRWLRTYCREYKIILIEIDGRKYTGLKIKQLLRKRFLRLGFVKH